MPKGNLAMNFSAYGLLFALGIAISAIVAILICKKRNIERYEIVYSGVFTMAGAVIGAKLFFLLVSIKLIIETKPGIPDLIRGGFVFYGGLVGGMAGLFIYVKNISLMQKTFLIFLPPSRRSVMRSAGSVAFSAAVATAYLMRDSRVIHMPLPQEMRLSAYLFCPFNLSRRAVCFFYL